LLKVISRYLERGHDWVQVFDTVANFDESWRTRLLAYAFALINGVLLLGQSALGLSAGLRGNGMCFSIRGLGRFPWKSFGLVEDLEYSWSLRIAGEKIAFAPEASVRATMLTQGGRAATAQRKRWESGRRELKSRMLGPLLLSRHIGLIPKVAAVLELMMPTLVVLCFLLLTSVLLATGFVVTNSAWSRNWVFLTLLVVDAVGLCGWVCYGALPFFLFSLRWNVLASLIHLPAYALWKLSMAFHDRPIRWIRTERTPGISPLASPTPARCTSNNSSPLHPPKNG
jgi:hypothetical protein